MSVCLDQNVIVISSPVRVEDAETLLDHLQADPDRRVDIARAGPLHTAVFQLLLAFRPALAGPSADPFVQTWLVPILAEDHER